jgi:hypothetical protein
MPARFALSWQAQYAGQPKQSMSAHEDRGPLLKDHGAVAALRDITRRSVLVWGPLLAFAGAYLTVYVTESDDPCCHVQTPGAMLLAVGAISYYAFLNRRARYEDLMVKSASVHGWHDHEKELDEVSRKLPRSYRRRFREARQQYGGRR